VLSENFFLNETKNHNPSPFKLNGRSLKDIDSLIFNYLWDNKPPKIKREVILQKTNQGGLNITDIHVYTYSKSVKFRWVKKLLDSSFESSWKDIIKLRYHIFNQNFIFNCDLNTSDIANITRKDIFWTDSLKFFFELKSKEKIPLNVDSIIWYNSFLKIEGKTLFYKELFDNNIIFIKDILDEENKFKTYDELNQRLPGACNRSPGSKLLSITTQLHCGGHLGGRA
jgi:hypothetical protein